MSLLALHSHLSLSIPSLSAVPSGSSSPGFFLLSSFFFSLVFAAIGVIAIALRAADRRARQRTDALLDRERLREGA